MTPEEFCRRVVEIANTDPITDFAIELHAQAVSENTLCELLKSDPLADIPDPIKLAVRNAFRNCAGGFVPPQRYKLLQPRRRR